MDELVVEQFLDLSNNLLTWVLHPTTDKTFNTLPPPLPPKAQLKSKDNKLFSFSSLFIFTLTSSPWCYVLLSQIASSSILHLVEQRFKKKICTKFRFLVIPPFFPTLFRSNYKFERTVEQRDKGRGEFAGGTCKRWASESANVSVNVPLFAHKARVLSKKCYDERDCTDFFRVYFSELSSLKQKQIMKDDECPY